MDIITYISQFLYDIRVPLGIKIPYIISVNKIQIIERAFIAAHIPLIHQIHSDRISIRLYAIPNQLVFRRDDNFNLPTRRKGKDKDAYIK